MILRFPLGYRTRMGDGGALLSAGQRQRIALARALYKEPFLVVLDEPNSNLDSEGEEALTRAILGIRERSGVAIVIAHRPNVLTAVDMLLVLAEGRVQAFGSKADVLQRIRRPPRCRHSGRPRLRPPVSSSEEDPSIRRHIRLGVTVVVLLLGGMGSWAVATKLAGAVIAPGNTRGREQRQEGPAPDRRRRQGVARARKATRLHWVTLWSCLTALRRAPAWEIIVGGLNELDRKKSPLGGGERRNRGCRLPGRTRFACGRAEPAQNPLRRAELVCLAQSGADGSKAAVARAYRPMGKEVEGFAGQASAKEREIAFVAKELAGTQQLYQQGLMTLTRLTDVERTAARLDGERAQLVASIAEAKGRIAETELEIIQIDQKLRSEVGTQLADLRTKLAELEERRTAAQDQLDRLAIRAPQSGTVHDLAVHTIGGVVQAAEPLNADHPLFDGVGSGRQNSSGRG